jgi:hypothetical protein
MFIVDADTPLVPKRDVVPSDVDDLKPMFDTILIPHHETHADAEI